MWTPKRRKLVVFSIFNLMLLSSSLLNTDPAIADCVTYKRQETAVVSWLFSNACGYAVQVNHETFREAPCKTGKGVLILQPGESKVATALDACWGFRSSQQKYNPFMHLGAVAIAHSSGHSSQCAQYRVVAGERGSNQRNAREKAIAGCEQRVQHLGGPPGCCRSVQSASDSQHCIAVAATPEGAVPWWDFGEARSSTSHFAKEEGFSSSRDEDEAEKRAVKSCNDGLTLNLPRLTDNTEPIRPCKVLRSICVP